MKSNPNGLSGELEHPSDVQSREAGFLAFRAVSKVEIVEEKRRRSVAAMAVSCRETTAPATRDRVLRRVTRTDFILKSWNWGMVKEDGRAETEEWEYREAVASALVVEGN